MDKSPRLYSYVVTYDSGFAPNPFFGFCTLATCKPEIRKSARIGDWIIGTGSANSRVNRRGCLVYAMKVTEIISMQEYWSDPRFQRKKPKSGGSWLNASGDNIYQPLDDGSWNQLYSYHSQPDGQQRMDHTAKDTKHPYVLVSNDFVYFGGMGPEIPSEVSSNGQRSIVKDGRGYLKIGDSALISKFESFLKELGQTGLCGEPWDWIVRMKHDKRGQPA